MAIPASSIVQVDVIISEAFPARAGFGILNIISTDSGLVSGKTDLYLLDRIRSYSSIDGVAEDWETSSEAYKAANTYFSQQPKPTQLKISIRNPDETSGALLGGVVEDTTANLALFTGISDGAFTISIDGDEEEITTLDFSSDTSLDDIASTIEVGLQAVGSGGYGGSTCAYSSSDERFVINSGTTGEDSSVSFMSAPAGGTDISSLLEMQEEEGILRVGTEAETITDSLTNINSTNDDWYGFAFTKEVRDLVEINSEDAVEAAVDWTEARVKVFFNTTNDSNVLVASVDTDIASIIAAKEADRTMTTFSSTPSQYPSVSAAGRAFTVNFNQSNSTITLKFKQLPGITPEDLSQTQKDTLDAKHCSVYFNVGGLSIFGESFMGGDLFFDERHGIDWLVNAIQTQLFGYLVTRPTKVPYTDKGVAALEQQAVRVLDEAVNNGLVAAGTTIDGVFLPNGYRTETIPVADVSSSEVSARNYPGLSFLALGAGSIHRVQISGIFER
jgi:hypothetical protein